MEERHKFKAHINSRKQIRKKLVKKFLTELPGTETKDSASKHVYEVDSFENYTIELQRPARINRGFDFTIEVKTEKQNISFKAKRNKKQISTPSHDAVFEILEDYKSKFADKYDNIKQIINKYYNCDRVDLSKYVLPNYTDHLGENRPIEIILLCLKWMFVEQDITYWNYSGREKLYKELQKRKLA